MQIPQAIFPNTIFRNSCLIRKKFRNENRQTNSRHARNKNHKREEEKSYIPVTFYKNNGNMGGTFLPENKDIQIYKNFP